MAWPLIEEFCFSFPVTEEIQELSRIQIGGVTGSGVGQVPGLPFGGCANSDKSGSLPGV